MGFLSKAWKGVKKGFKSIGKGIKSAFKKFGKFMGKIGILGQIAMMFIIPYVGGMLMKGLSAVGSAVVGQTAGQVAATAAGTAAGTTATAAATAAGATTTAAATAGATAASAATASTAATIAAGQAAGATAAQVAASTTAIGTSTATGLMSGGAIAQGAGQVLQAAGNFVKVGMNAFSTVTDGISSFIGEFGKTALNKIPGINIQSAATDFSGAWGRVQTNVMTNATKTMASFNKAIGYTPPTVITAPSAPNLSAGTQGIDLASADVSEVASQGLMGSPNTVGPLKDGYSFPEVATAPNTVGPLKDGYGLPEVATAPSTVDPIKSFAENSKSLLAPSVSPVSGYGPLKANPQFSTTPLDPSSMPNVGPQPYERGFMEQATNSLGEVYRNAKTELSEGWDNFKANPVETLVGKDPVGKVFDTASGQLTGTVIQRGIMGKPEAPRTYVNQVAAFEPAAGMGEYGSPEINARAYEMTNNPTDFLANNVFGQPAGIVQQAYMRSMAKSGFGG